MNFIMIVSNFKKSMQNNFSQHFYFKEIVTYIWVREIVENETFLTLRVNIEYDYLLLIVLNNSVDNTEENIVVLTEAGYSFNRSSEPSKGLKFYCRNLMRLEVSMCFEVYSNDFVN